jgi:competence ComEA-like helix-hairpin-helix protein
MQIPENAANAGNPHSEEDPWKSRAFHALSQRNRAWRTLAVAALVSAGAWVALRAAWPTSQDPLPAEFVVELNQASAAELNLLPGIGPKTVNAILSYRDAAGGFTRIEELTRIPGIKDGKLRSLRPFVTVDPRNAKR